MPLTELQVRNAKPAERAYKLSDGEGLFLLVQPNRSKLWRMKYRFAGKEKLLSFGAYLALGIAAARQKRCSSREILKRGTSQLSRDHCLNAGRPRSTALPTFRDWRQGCPPGRTSAGWRLERADRCRARSC